MTGGGCPDYLAGLARALRRAGLDRPAMVIDVDRLDANARIAARDADPGLNRRLVAKSLPSAPLLAHLRDRLGATGYMTFSTDMLDALLRAEPDGDHLLGKPVAARAARRVLDRHPQAAARVQWLVDTDERLDEYAALARATGLALRLSLEIDIGLHRGGFDAGDVARIRDRIEAAPGLELAGLMGYDAHLAKLPKLLKHRAGRRCDTRFRRAVAALGPGAGRLCLNTGGSLTFGRYGPDGSANEIAFGSILVKPSDFDTLETAGFAPAAFIATPVLKVLANNRLPGLDIVHPLRRKRMNIAIHGGQYLARPVHPPGFTYSPVFGRSSNQEVWQGPSSPAPRPGDIALLHPTQSEFVLGQFGPILAVRAGEIVARWPVLPQG